MPKNIQLKELELSNYRNIDHAKYQFDGNSKIIGENRIGKTNTLEAIYWLLTDKLLDGSSDVSAIKPLKDTKLEVRVKATFDVGGKEVTLEKNYKENWVATRGTAEMIMKGHTCTCLHNGVKQTTIKAYEDLVDEDFGFSQDAKTRVDFMQMLINPFYLGNMGEGKDWTDLRNFIIKLVGDVNDDDVVNTNPKFQPVKIDLDSVGGRVDQLKKKYANDIEGLKNTILSDDAQIKLLEATACPSDDEIAVAKKAIQEHEDKIVQLKSQNGIDVISNELNNKIQSKKLEVANLEKEDLTKSQNDSGRKNILDSLNELRARQNELLGKKMQCQTMLHNMEINKSYKENDIRECKNLRTDFIDQLKSIDAQLNSTEEIICPTCHQPMPRDEIVKNLTDKKDEIIAKGKANTEAMNNHQIDLDEIVKNISEEEKEMESLIDELSKVSSQISAKQEELQSAVVVVEPNPQIAVLKDEIAKLEEEHRISRDNFARGVQNTQQAIYDEEVAMQPFKQVLANRDYFNRQHEKLDEIRNCKTNHTLSLVDIEQKRELLNQFIYTKLRMLDDNVAKVFGDIKFQLIKENINGGFDTICKVYIYDVSKGESTTTSWKSGSKSERVTTGIAIAEKIKAKLDLPNLPYLFDEGGEISADTLATRFNTESQLICVKIADNILNPLVQKL